MSSGKHILLVEDDAITCGAVKMVLEWEGYNASGYIHKPFRPEELLEVIRSQA